MGEAPAMEAFPGHAWRDDRIVSNDALLVSSDDPGFLIGDGIFETMRRVLRGFHSSIATVTVCVSISGTCPGGPGSASTI